MEGAVTQLTVAIMQPYFLPYAGYSRLFAATDLFVVYDCVQFPRRGWVHRNRLVNTAGAERSSLPGTLPVLACKLGSYFRQPLA
jgi:WbqC-like protein family